MMKNVEIGTISNPVGVSDEMKTLSHANTGVNSAMLWMVAWLINNIGVTLLNKAAFARVNFSHPYFLSFLHMFCNSLGSQMVFHSIKKDLRRLKKAEGDQNYDSKTNLGVFSRIFGSIARKELNSKDTRYVVVFSVIFSLNIAIGNVSLRYVSVNFNQVMRSLVPAITIVMGIALGKSFSLQRKLAIIPVALGVSLACFGDISYTALGFTYTVACIFLAALKVVSAGEILTGTLKLHPVDLLGHMAPLAMVQCLLLSFLSGEVFIVYDRISAFYQSADYHDNSISFFTKYYPAIVVISSGVFSFSLNICSFMANRLTSPLTLCIAANVKQVLMIMLSTFIFGVEITPLNGTGIFVVLLGSAYYSYVSVQEKQQHKVQQEQSDSQYDAELNRNELEGKNDAEATRK